VLLPGSCKRLRMFYLSERSLFQLEVRIITVLPDAPQRGVIELALGASDPQNVIVPVHALVLDIWGRLPNLPLKIAEWVLASKRKLHALESRSGKSGPLRYFQDNKTAIAKREVPTY
jgi:hypothetical protein